MAGLFANIRLPEGIKMKPTGGLVEIQALETSSAEEAFFGGYASLLDDLGADLMLEAPKTRTQRKIQG